MQESSYCDKQLIIAKKDGQGITSSLRKINAPKMYDTKEQPAGKRTKKAVL